MRRNGPNISTPESRTKEKGAGFGDLWEALGGGIPWRSSSEEIDVYHRAETARLLRHRKERAMSDSLPTHAISVRPSWAWAIATGHKLFENRTWRLPTSRIATPVYLHASARDTPESYADCAAICQSLGVSLPALDSLPSSALLALIEFPSRCTTPRAAVCRSSPWASGPRCWPVRVISALSTPIPCRGALGFWRVPDDVQSAVPRSLREVA